MTPTIECRRPGLRSVAWAAAIVLLGAALGLGLNHVSSVGINMTIALGLDEPAQPAAGAQP
ncbi:MAG TPA: hypothetical protein VK842_10460 [bacterium]|jgi:hypothetical protein|nr:hypothetical protein [bacterium]